jgi:hypothetical protein
MNPNLKELPNCIRVISGRVTKLKASSIAQAEHQERLSNEDVSLRTSGDNSAFDTLHTTEVSLEASVTG